MIEEAVKHPPRGKGKNTLMLEAIRAEMGDKVGEHEFLRKVIRVGLGQDGEDPNPTFKSMIDIEEYTDLKERIEKLEATLNGES